MHSAQHLKVLRTDLSQPASFFLQTCSVSSGFTSTRRQGQYQRSATACNLNGDVGQLLLEMKVFWKKQKVVSCVICCAECLSVTVYPHHGGSSASVLSRRHDEAGVWKPFGKEEQGWSLPDPRQRDHPGSLVFVCLVSTLHSVFERSGYTLMCQTSLYQDCFFSFFL